MVSTYRLRSSVLLVHLPVVVSIPRLLLCPFGAHSSSCLGRLMSGDLCCVPIGAGPLRSWAVCPCSAVWGPGVPWGAPPIGARPWFPDTSWHGGRTWRLCRAWHDGAASRSPEPCRSCLKLRLMMAASCVARVRHFRRQVPVPGVLRSSYPFEGWRLHLHMATVASVFR